MAGADDDGGKDDDGSGGDDGTSDSGAGNEGPPASDDRNDSVAEPPSEPCRTEQSYTLECP